MKITVIEYGGIEHYISCKSFEFRTNKVANWVKIKYQDGSQEMIYEIATIKAESEVSNDKRFNEYSKTVSHVWF